MEQPNLRVYEFEAVVEKFTGIGSSFALEFPFSVQEEFGTKGIVRVCGFLNEATLERSLMPRGNGTHFILLSHKLCRKAGVAEGETARVKLQFDPRPREARIPEELEVAFELEPEARLIFDHLSPGYQRSICAYIDEAKRPETREQRMNLMVNRMLTGYFKAATKKAKAATQE